MRSAHHHGPQSFWMDAAPRVEPLLVRRMPMLLAAACFAAGIALAHGRWYTPLELVCPASVLLLLTGAALRYCSRIALLPALALCMVAGCWCAEIQRPLTRQEALHRYADGLSRTVRGTVVQVRPLAPPTPEEPHEAAQAYLADPAAWEVDTNPARVTVDLQLMAVEDVTPDVSTMRPIAGGLRLTLHQSAAALRCGDVLEAPVRLREPDVYRDPGAWSQGDQLLTEGIAALGSMRTSSHSTQLRVIGHDRSDWRCSLRAAQSWASARIRSLPGSPIEQRLPPFFRLSEGDGSLLAAMLFGDRTGLQRSVRTGFERTGTFHLFVVSGLHVALVAGGLLWLLRRARVPYAPAVLLSLAFTSLYALLTGWGVPVQRALLMTGLYLFARALNRRASSLNALGGASALVLAWDPRALFTASFQMTFLVIFAMAALATPLQERLFGRLRMAVQDLEAVRLDAWVHPALAGLRVGLRMWGDLLANLLATSQSAGAHSLLQRVAYALPRSTVVFGSSVGATFIACIVVECCTALPMAMYFHRATLLALPANLLSLPLIGLLLASAFATFACALMSCKLALLPALAVAALLHTVHGAVMHIGSTRAADIRVAGPALAGILAASCLALWGMWALRSERRPIAATGLIAVLLLPIVVLWPVKPKLQANTLEVTALDVGQGDSLLLVSPDGHTLLVDAGGPVGQQSLAADRWDIGEEVVAPYLWSRHLSRLDAVMLTHAHSDHMGGMPAVLRDLRPRELWLGVQPGEAPGLLALRQQAAELGIAVRWFRAGDSFAWGGTNATVLAPESGYANAGTAVNDDSLVLRMQYGKASVLLEGDAETRSEQTMLAHDRVQACTLLKVGHHGSRTSTTPEFLAAVSPRAAVISVGHHNTFGHPRMEVLQRLEAAGAKTARTDRVGLETFLLTADGNVSMSNGTQQ